MSFCSTQFQKQQQPSRSSRQQPYLALSLRVKGAHRPSDGRVLLEEGRRRYTKDGCVKGRRRQWVPGRCSSNTDGRTTTPRQGCSRAREARRPRSTSGSTTSTPCIYAGQRRRWHGRRRRRQYRRGAAGEHRRPKCAQCACSGAVASAGNTGAARPQAEGGRCALQSRPAGRRCGLSHHRRWRAAADISAFAPDFEALTCSMCRAMPTFRDIARLRRRRVSGNE